MKQLAIFDGSYYISRALSAMKPFSLYDREVHGTLGALSMFNKDIKEYKPDHVVFVFDHPGTNFRHSIYKDYKKNMAAHETVENKQYQTRLCAYLLKTAGFNVVHQQGVEADDVIASICLSHSDYKIKVFTGDKDLQQLVTSTVTTTDTRQIPHWEGTPDSVYHKYGVHPNQIADYLALMGDKNDNVPGVQGIGSVKACSLLKEYKDVATILKAKILTNEQASMLRLSYKLTKLSANCKPDLTLYEGLPIINQAAVDHLETFFKGGKMPKLFDAVITNSTLSKHSLFDDIPCTDERDFEEWENVLSLLDDTADTNDLWDTPYTPQGSLF